MHLTATEWKGLGGKKADSTNKSYRPLPFDACALSLQPFEVRPSARPSASPSAPIKIHQAHRPSPATLPIPLPHKPDARVHAGGRALRHPEPFPLRPEGGLGRLIG